MNALFLALAYLRYHWVRSSILVLVGAVILFVPLATNVLLTASERQLTARADATPLILGSRGSQLDLAMNALYYAETRPDPITMAAHDAVWDSDLAMAIPLHTAFSAEGARIIGTSLDYFDFRELQLSKGRMFGLLGEAVIGSAVAERLGKGVGDTLISTPENLFDISGTYPLEMPITGVLAPSGSPDDRAVFVDVKTTWVISGIGHGHQDVITGAEGDVTVAPGILEYTRITPEDVDSFHFHGDPADYPISAVIAVPPDLRAGTILRGRYLGAENPIQIMVPGEVIRGLVDRMFRIKALLDAVSSIIGLAAIASIGLALYLAFRLRAKEIETAVKLGARRAILAQLLLAEIGIVLGLAVGLVGLALAILTPRADGLITTLLAAGV